ncbi:hypothetical protein D9M69_571320 [compost metagenome]
MERGECHPTVKGQAPIGNAQPLDQGGAAKQRTRQGADQGHHPLSAGLRQGHRHYDDDHQHRPQTGKQQLGQREATSSSGGRLGHVFHPHGRDPESGPTLAIGNKKPGAVAGFGEGRCIRTSSKMTDLYPSNPVATSAVACHHAINGNAPGKSGHITPLATAPQARVLPAPPRNQQEGRRSTSKIKALSYLPTFSILSHVKGVIE